MLEKGLDPVSEPPNKKIEDPKEAGNRLFDVRLVLGDSLYMLAVLQLTRNARFKGVDKRL